MFSINVEGKSKKFRRNLILWSAWDPETEKKTNKHRRSGSSENDVLADAHMIYSQDTCKKFEVKHAWLLLKDQPKFDA